MIISKYHDIIKISMQQTGNAMEGGRVILSSRVIGLVLILCLVHTLRKDKQDYFLPASTLVCFPHSSSVKEVNWDTRHCTKWRTHVHVTISMSVKRARATTAYYANSTSTFRPVIQLLHDVELNPGPANCSSGNKSEKSNSNVKIAHLNVRSLKCREHFVLVKNAVLENKFDIFTVSETWLNSSVTDLEIEIPGYAIYRIDRQAKVGGGVCAYVSRNYRTEYLSDISLITASGFHQLWLKIHVRNMKSFIVCTTLLYLVSIQILSTLQTSKFSMTSVRDKFYKFYLLVCMSNKFSLTSFALTSFICSCERINKLTL